MGSSGFGRFLPLFAFLLFLGAAAPASAVVDDRGGVFSAQAVSEANAIIEEIARSTNPSKAIEVQTLASISPDENAQSIAEGAFRQRRLNGILVFIVKNPRKLVIVIGKNTQARFQKADELRNIFITGFRANRYDEGLLNAVGYLKEHLPPAFSTRAAAYPPNNQAARYAPQQTQPLAPVGESSSGFGLGRLLFIGLIAWFAMRLFSGRRGFGRGLGGGLGGGMGGSPFLSGLFGGLAGNFLYNRLFGGGMGNAWGSQIPQDYNGYNSGPSDTSSFSDDGGIGSSSSGSWSDGGDFGGGGGSSGGGGNDW